MKTSPSTPSFPDLIRSARTSICASRTVPTGKCRPCRLFPTRNPPIDHRIFNIQDPVHYFVAAGGRRSDEYTIKVADLPKLEKMDYTYHFPAYTKMADKNEENGFDMVALKGTTVAVVANRQQAAFRRSDCICRWEEHSAEAFSDQSQAGDGECRHRSHDDVSS